MSTLQKLVDLEEDARSFGFYWTDAFMILDQIMEECREVREDIESNVSKEKIQEEIGDLFHAVMALCNFVGLDADDTIEKISVKFSNRMRILKEITKAKGLENLHGQDISYKLAIWHEAKNLEKKS